MAIRLGDAVMYLNADRSGLTSGLAAGEADAQNWATKIKGLAMGVSLAFVGVGIAATNASTELNEKMGNVQSLGVALDRVNELKGGVQDLAIQYGTDTGSMALATYEVVSALGDTADTLDTVELSAKTAAAGLADPKEAFGLLVAVTKAYGDTSQESMVKVSDMAFQAVNLGQTTFPELAAAIGAVTPMAVALGVSQAELFAQMATLTGVTGSTSEVTTQLRATYQAILKPTGDMAEALAVVAGQLDAQGKLTAGPMVDGWQAATATHEQAIAKLADLRSEFEQVEGSIGATDATTQAYKAELDQLRLSTKEQELSLRQQLLALDENTEGGKAQAVVIRDQIAQLKLDKEQRELAIQAQMTASGTSQELTDRYKDLKTAIKDQEDAVKSSSDAVDEQAAALGGAIVQAVGVNDTLTMLTETTGGNTNEIGKMFGSVEALSAVMALSGSQADSYDAKLNAMRESSGALDAAFKAQTEGINANGFTMEQVSAKAQVLMEKLGDGLAPAVNKILDLATPLIDRLVEAADWFANTDAETQTWILSIGGLLAVLGPLLVVLGPIVSGISAVAGVIGPVIGLIAGGTGLTALVGGLGTALTVLTGPVGLVVAAVAALAAAWKYDFLGIKTTGLAVLNDVQVGFKNFTRAVSDLFEDFDWRELGEDMVNGLIDGVKGLWKNAVDTVNGLGQSMLDGFKRMFGISSPSTVFAGVGKDMMAGLEVGIDDGGERASNTLTSWSQGAIDADIQKTFAHLKDINTNTNAIAPGSVATTNNEYSIYLQQTGQLTTDLAGTIRLLNALFGG